MNELEIIRLIIEIILLLIVFYLAFLKSYFKEKGKQLAIKEDIEEITVKVESIKSDFQRENDDLKAKIQHLLTIQETHRNEERNVIIDFYRKYNDWLYSLLEIPYATYNRGNIPDISNVRIQINKYYRITNVAQAMINLLIKDDEIIKKSNELIINILQFKDWINIRLLKLQQNLEGHDSLTNQFLKLIKDFDKNRDVAAKLAGNEKELIKKRKYLKDEYYDNITNEYSKILPTNNKFSELVKDYLTGV